MAAVFCHGLQVLSHPFCSIPSNLGTSCLCPLLYLTSSQSLISKIPLLGAMIPKASTSYLWTRDFCLQGGGSPLKKLSVILYTLQPESGRRERELHLASLWLWDTFPQCFDELLIHHQVSHCSPPPPPPPSIRLIVVIQ